MNNIHLIFGKWNKNIKDLTAVYQNDILKANPKYCHLNGTLVALYMLAEQRQKGHRMWLAWNLSTNNIYGPIVTYNFTIGHGLGTKNTAGKSYAELNNSRLCQRVDLTGKEFGYITVIEETGNRQVGDARIEWLAHCNACGKDFTKDSHSIQKMVSCGCLNKYSNEAILIRKLLEDNKIKHKQEFIFNDCRDINPLPFDFAIENLNKETYLLEYDGEQHFTEVQIWGNFKITHEHDLIKNHYCFEHNIKLLRIPFDKKYTLDDILLKSTKFLLTPENEKEYYESRGCKYK